MPHGINACMTKGLLTQHLVADPNYCAKNGYGELDACYALFPVTQLADCDPSKLQPVGDGSAPKGGGRQNFQVAVIARKAIDEYTHVLSLATQQVTDQTATALTKLENDYKTKSDKLTVALEQTQTTALSTINGLVDKAEDATQTIVNNALETSTRINDVVVDAIPDAFEGISDLADRTAIAIEEGIGAATDSLSSITETALDGVQTTLGEINDATLNNYNTLGVATDNILTNASNNVSDILTRLDTQLIQSIDATSDITASTNRKLDSNLDTLFTGFDDVIQGYGGRLSNFLDDSTTEVGELVTSLGKTITRLVDTDVNRAKALLDVVIDKVADLPATVRTLTSELTSSAEKNILDPLERVGERIATALGEQISNAIGLDQNAYKNILKSVVGDSQDPDNIVNRTVDAMLPDNGLNIGLRAVMFAIATPLIAWSTLQGIAAVNSQKIMHEYSFNNPSQLLTPPDLVNALKRDNVTLDKFTDDLKRSGYYPEDIETLAKLGRQLVDPVSAHDLWLRELFSDEQLKEALTGVGINPTDQEALRKATALIPPVNDLILMAVREVFTPDIALELGLFDEFPDAITEHTAKQGLTQEWTERYWAAHWQLPSPQMGFDMFHRGIIDEDQLSILLRALDIVPAWRDKIIQLSYNPLTRVDVRRMHKLDVLTTEEVTRAYQDIGYSPENALRLTDFTVEFNKSPSERDEPELRQLTRGNILAFYKTKVLDRDKTIELLIELNYSPDTATLFVDDIDYKQDIKERKNIVANIAAQYDNNVIDYSTAEDELYKSGLTGREVTTALNDLLATQQAKITVPTKADLLKFLKSKIIDTTVFIDAMTRLGYRQPWINAYIEDTVGEKLNA